MRILNLIRTMNPKIGGPAFGIHSLSKGFRQLGSTNDVVCLDDPQADWVGNSPSYIVALGEPLGFFGYSKPLVCWLKDHAAEYDAVISHGVWNFPSLAAWLVLRKSNIPWFVVPHGSLDPWFRVAYPMKEPKKWFYWKLFGSRIIRDCQGVFFTCTEECSRARGAYKPYNCQEVVVQYGIPAPDVDETDARNAFVERFPELTGKRMVLLLSRIVKQKGCDILIDAFANVCHKDPALQLVLSGPDQTGWRSELERQAQRLGISSRITWTGPLSGPLKWGAFYSSDIFALPSHMENFGVAVAESLAAGLPVLISDKVQIWKEIAESNAGLVADDSVAGMTTLLNRWLSLPESDRSAMRRATKTCFIEKFHTTSAARSWLNAISTHLQNGVLLPAAVEVGAHA